MNIAEVERRTGLTRANIRFYEKEGLIAPARSANGYRDYTEADVETLRKVRLLRQLRVPVPEIRAVQAANTPCPRRRQNSLTCSSRTSATASRHMRPAARSATTAPSGTGWTWTNTCPSRCCRPMPWLRRRAGPHPTRGMPVAAVFRAVARPVAVRPDLEHDGAVGLPNEPGFFFTLYLDAVVQLYSVGAGLCL